MRDAPINWGRIDHIYISIKAASHSHTDRETPWKYERIIWVFCFNAGIPKSRGFSTIQEKQSISFENFWDAAIWD